MNRENFAKLDSSPPNTESFGLTSDTFNTYTTIGKTALSEAMGQVVDSNPSRALVFEFEENWGDARSEAEDFIKANEQIVRFIAGDDYLSIGSSDAIDTFCFNGREERILVPTCWFLPNKDFTDEERYFSVIHEVGHFLDLREAVKHEDEYSKNKPQKTNAYLDNFDIMEEKAGSLAQGYLKTHPEASLKQIKKFYYDRLHDLYNVLDDIYVNKLVQKKVPFFRGDGQKAIESLYVKLGFNEPDMSKAPLHSQLIDSLLAEAMLGSKLGEVKVDPLVSSALNKTVYGKTLKENIERKIAPTESGKLVDPGLRYYFIRKHIEPEYLKLLELDIGAGLDTPENPAPRRTEGELSDEVDESDSGTDQADDKENGQDDTSKGTPSIFNTDRDYEKEDEHVRDVIDDIREGNEWKRKTSNEKHEIQDQEQIKKSNEELGITETQRKIHDEAVAQIDGYLSEMSEFWNRIIGKSVNHVRKTRDKQTKGYFNKDNYINSLSELQKGSTDKPRIYERKVLVRETVNQAEKIEATLLVDSSGSMSGEKTEAARQTAALLMYSIRDFNDKLAKARKNTHSKLYADTEVIVFGGDYEEIKPFGGRSSSNANDAAIIKSISAIQGDRSGTNDGAPLEYLLNKLSAQEKTNIKKQKLKKIIFEITDGASQTSELTTEKLDQLASEGVVVIGFQVGDVSEQDRRTFEAIWNNQGKNPNKIGIYVKDISDLPRMLMNALSSQLSNLSS